MERTGIDFFPFPSANSTALKLVEAKFKLRGVAVYLKLLQKIFGEEGYYFEISDDVILLLKQEMGVNDNIIPELINECIARGLFDKEMYEKYSIITSDTIQKEYLNAVRKRKNFNIKEEFRLPFATKFLKTAEEKQKTAEENGKTAEEIDKGKERKGNIKETSLKRSKETAETPPSHSQEKRLDTNLSNTPTSENLPTKQRKTSTKASKSTLTALEQEQIRKFQEQTGKYVADVKKLPPNIDMDKLIAKVKQSEFLMHAHNMTLKNCLKHYSKILQGCYDNAKPSSTKSASETVNTHAYTKEQLDSFFTNLDDWEF